MTAQTTSEGGTGQPTTGLAGLSVPLGVHIERVDAERTKRLEGEIRHAERETEHVREIFALQRANDQLSIEKALASQEKLAEKHNDLIRAGEKKDETYATKDDVNRLEKWQARLTGGLILLGAIGLGNFVKLWGG